MTLLRSAAGRIGVALALLAALAGATGAGFVYFTLLRDLPDFHSLADYSPALTSVVLDRDGREIGEFFEQRRRLVKVAELPEHVVLAFVASEDDAFFEHQGLEYLAILRAAWVDLVSGEKKQGASTITMQTAKNLLLTPERRLRRKLKEMILARRIEQRFTKDEILTLYLNEIYFGSGAYGVAEAARTYFGKDARALDLSEAALLAGLPKAPSKNSPVTNPEGAEERRRYVLGRMLEAGFADQATIDAARAAPPALAPPARAEDFAAAGSPSTPRSTSTSSAPRCAPCARASRRSTAARATGVTCGAWRPGRSRPRSRRWPRRTAMRRRRRSPPASRSWGW